MSVRIIVGDSTEALRDLADNSVDALVTDPPAGIEFMGKDWDSPWSQGFTKTGYSDGANRVKRPTQRLSVRNPMCKACHKHIRGAGGCECSEPQSDESPQDTQRLRNQQREAFVQRLLDVFLEAYRVMKPGAHGLVWALPRTSHWTATALEDAGFEIRDVVCHLFGTGFPKSHNISIAIDKINETERPVVDSFIRSGRSRGILGTPTTITRNVTEPASDEAKTWDGWGTALKPAAENWLLVRKPLSEKNVAANVLKFGTGGLNIDASRIKGTDEIKSGLDSPANRQGVVGTDLGFAGNDAEKFQAAQIASLEKANELGRFPANVILSHNPDCEPVGERTVPGNNSQVGKPKGKRTGGFYDIGSDKGESVPNGPTYGDTTVTEYECTPDCAVAELDRQSGHSTSPKVVTQGGKDGGGFDVGSSDGTRHRVVPGHGDSGGASRFFYVPKPSKSEKNAGGVTNSHPTVKAVTLMEYLVRMITPPGGTVLDPFMGSGGTGIAAVNLGCSFIGIEREQNYADIAKARILHAEALIFEAA